MQMFAHPGQITCFVPGHFSAENKLKYDMFMQMSLRNFYLFAALNVYNNNKIIIIRKIKKSAAI